MLDRRMRALFAAAAAALCWTAAAAQELPAVNMDPIAGCRKKFDSPRAIVANTLHRVKNAATLKALSNELQAVLVCDARAARIPDPCKQSVADAVTATGGPDAKAGLGGTLFLRCQHDVRFAEFYREALAAKKGQQSFPACVSYHKHDVPVLAVGDGFDAVCADIAAAIQSGNRDMCSPKAGPFVKDAKTWPAMCQAVSRVWINGDVGACAYFPNQDYCRAEASIAEGLRGGQCLVTGTAAVSALPGMATSAGTGVGTGVDAGVCAAAAAKNRGTACRGLWQQLQGDFCTELVREGITKEKKGGDSNGADGDAQ